MRASEYYGFFVLTLIGVGMLFQIPVGVLAVTRLGIVTPQQLAKNRRYAILIIAVVAMLLPGTDPVTMLICDGAALPAVRVLGPAGALLRQPRRGGSGSRLDEARRRADRFLYPPGPMIFDLKSGKRRRVVQVVFGFLAFIFFISFVGFGIGSDVTGGIFDALGLGGDNNSRQRPAVRPADRGRPETRSTANPKSANAYADLIAAYYGSRAVAGSSSRPADRRSSRSATRPRSDLQQAAQAWDDYFKTKPKQADRDHGRATPCRSSCCSATPSGAAEAQQVVADDQGTAVAYAQLAFYLLRRRQTQAGRRRRRAGVAAADSTNRKQVEKAIDGYREQAIKFQEQLAQQQEQGGQEAGEQQLNNPFGDLGGGRPPRSPRRPEPPRYDPGSGPLAQLVEQETLNLKVTGSIPVRPT